MPVVEVERKRDVLPAMEEKIACKRCRSHGIVDAAGQRKGLIAQHLRMAGGSLSRACQRSNEADRDSRDYGGALQ